MHKIQRVITATGYCINYRGHVAYKRSILPLKIDSANFHPTQSP